MHMYAYIQTVFEQGRLVYSQETFPYLTVSFPYSGTAVLYYSGPILLCETGSCYIVQAHDER